MITGCSAGKSQEATGTEGKEERTEQSAAGGTESTTEGTGTGKDSVIVVMGPSSGRRPDLILLTDGGRASMSMSL